MLACFLQITSFQLNLRDILSGHNHQSNESLQHVDLDISRFASRFMCLCCLLDRSSRRLSIFLCQGEDDIPILQLSVCRSRSALIGTSYPVCALHLAYKHPLVCRVDAKGLVQEGREVGRSFFRRHDGLSILECLMRPSTGSSTQTPRWNTSDNARLKSST